MLKSPQQFKDNLSFIGEVKIITTDSKTGKLLRETPWMKNQVMANSGRGVYILLDRLIGINTYSGNITHADIGTDNTAASQGDTNLISGEVRASVGSVSSSSNQRSLRFFFADTLTPDDTYYEFGMFIDGTASVGSGRIFNRIVFTTPLVKASGEDNTIVCRVTGNV